MNELDFLFYVPETVELSILDFLQKYKKEWISYCEIIILQNGNITLANPSHIERLIKLTGKERDYIYKIMPLYASPVHWLIGYTGNVAVWYNYQLAPKNVSKKQMLTLRKLHNENMIKLQIFEINEKDCEILEGE